MNANVYFGSPAGLSERYQTVLPAHRCTSVAAGDFDGDGRADLAFLTEGRVRLFLQTDLGIEAKEYVDTPIEGVQLGAADLDGDGHAELIVTAADRPPRIYWGGAGGIDPERWSEVPAPGGWAPPDLTETEELSEDGARGRRGAAGDRSVDLGSGPLVFVAGGSAQYLVPVTPERGFGPPLRFACRNALSVAAGDFDGDGRIDLAFACRDFEDGRECSWLYWGGAERVRGVLSPGGAHPPGVRRGPGRPARQRRLRPGDLPAAHGAVVHGGLAGVCRRQPAARRSGGAADARRPAGARRPLLRRSAAAGGVRQPGGPARRHGRGQLPLLRRTGRLRARTPDRSAQPGGRRCPRLRRRRRRLGRRHPDQQLRERHPPGCRLLHLLRRTGRLRCRARRGHPDPAGLGLRDRRPRPRRLPGPDRLPLPRPDDHDLPGQERRLRLRGSDGPDRAGGAGRLYPSPAPGAGRLRPVGLGWTWRSRRPGATAA